MKETIASQIIQKIDEVAELYHRLILIVAPSNTGKTLALQSVHERLDAPLININLELSRRMLDLTLRQRILQLPQLLLEIISESQADVILLDNIEILFDISLKQDPLRLLQSLSRSNTVVAAWNGSVEKENITYASPDHPEYRRYPIKDLIILSPGMMD